MNISEKMKRFTVIKYEKTQLTFVLHCGKFHTEMLKRRKEEDEERRRMVRDKKRMMVERLFNARRRDMLEMKLNFKSILDIFFI